MTAKKASQLSGRKFALSVGIEDSIIRGWQKQEEDLKALVQKNCQTRKIRRIPKKRVGYFPDIDAIVEKWVLQRNEHGIRVKDQFIRIRAVQARNELAQGLEDGEAKEKMLKFSASRIWCHRFKARFNFCSRRHTTAHSLPVDFREKAMQFIEEIHSTCEKFNIQRSHIINFDQVPRYFENDKSSTIVKRGTREVLLRKSSTSHKRFTFTPFITADGRILIKHALFSNLKNIPKHHPGCRVNCNKTGMWNSEVLKTHIELAAKLCRGMFNTRAPVLFIMDSYGVHLKFARESGDSLAEKNIYMVVVPPRLTGLLQPLDVAVNRSFQQAFNDKNDLYQEESLAKGINKTFKGNIKMPSALLVTEWVNEWAEGVTADHIRKSFDVCGLVPRNEFSVDALHVPLRDVFNRNVSVEEWITKHSNVVDASHLVVPADWSVFQGKNAFFLALRRATACETNAEEYCTHLKEKIIDLLVADPLTTTIFTTEDKAVIRAGAMFTSGYFEVYAVSVMMEIQIHFIEIDEMEVQKNRTIFGKTFEQILALYICRAPLKVIFPTEYTASDIQIVEEVNGDAESEQDEEFWDEEHLMSDGDDEGNVEDINNFAIVQEADISGDDEDYNGNESESDSDFDQN